jgi:hypothetical protein
MNDFAEKHWAEMEAMAQRLLEHPKDLEPRDTIRHYSSLWRLWQFPAFGVQKSWTILTAGRKLSPDAPPIVREVSWDRAADHHRVFDPIAWPQSGFNRLPTMKIRDALLPPLELDRFIDAGKQLAVPLIVSKNTVGLDGEYFGLETAVVSPFARVQWRNEGPAEWRHFTDWVATLRGFVLQHLDAMG